ncbi:hypothetical protein [Erwinia sp.]|uniref:hypothetical protein n=1 Tax=Erwinia citreus TaxID=558 RepID=UPI002899CC22|nr:hypothetical protein [Erwinia sp.]
MINLLNILKNANFDDELSLNKLFARFNVSYFTHYLSSDEFLNETLICFSDIGNDHEKERLFKDIEGKFFHLYTELYDLSKGRVSLVLDGFIYEYVDFSCFSKALELSLRENPLYNFYFHEVSLYVMSGYDLTHCFYLFKESDRYINVIRSAVKNSGLHILK